MRHPLKDFKRAYDRDPSEAVRHSGKDSIRDSNRDCSEGCEAIW